MPNLALNPRPGKVPAVAPLTAAQPDLVLGPRTRAVRSLLEGTHIRAELQDLLGDALVKARKRRDRPLAHLLEAALLANCDLGAELDAAGQAILQLDVLWNGGGPG